MTELWDYDDVLTDTDRSITNGMQNIRVQLLKHCGCPLDTVIVLALFSLTRLRNGIYCVEWDTIF